MPEIAREQISIALAMIDAVDLQTVSLNKELRAYARRHAGCKALMAQVDPGSG